MGQWEDNDKEAIKAYEEDLAKAEKSEFKITCDECGTVFSKEKYSQLEKMKKPVEPKSFFQVIAICSNCGQKIPTYIIDDKGNIIW